MNPDTIHVASFSPVQGAWHIETLREHVESNLNCLAQGVLKDTAYCAVLLAQNREDASEAIDRISAVLGKGGESL